jgi:hypothetical protein
MRHLAHSHAAPLAVEEPTPDNASTASKSSWFPLRLRGGIGPCCAMIDACVSGCSYMSSWKTLLSKTR